LIVAWTIKHVVRYNPGLVGGELQLAILEKSNGAWTAHYEGPGETEGQVEFLEEYISEFREKQRPDTAAESSQVDIHKELDAQATSSSDEQNPSVSSDANS
jgi:hypothetical protein